MCPVRKADRFRGEPGPFFRFLGPAETTQGMVVIVGHNMATNTLVLVLHDVFKKTGHEKAQEITTEEVEGAKRLGR